jgi:hypothetical protein
MPSVSITFTTMKGRRHMKTLRPVTRRLTGGFIAALCLLAFSGCDYKVPITPGPTRKVDDRLLGDWVSKDAKDKMKVRKLDDSIYICSYNGDLFQAFHSDVGKTSFISVQDIDSAERKYVYLIYTISADGNRLVVRSVNTNLIPKETKDSATVQRLLEDNLQNPALFDEEDQFTKEK